MASELTALPAPNVLVPLDYDSNLAAILAQFRGLNSDYTSIVEGDPGHTVLQAISWESIRLQKKINDAARAVLVTHAVGSDLDNLGALFAIYRQVVVVADPDADPPVEEILESDDRLRDRILNALEAIAPGSKAWYRGYALEASADVQDAIAVKTAPGTITVYVQSVADNAFPDAALLTTVKNYLNTDERRFICDTVNVLAVGIESYALTAAIKVVPGLDKDTVLTDVQARANAFVKERKVIGKEIPLSHIYAALLTEAVSEITLTSPTANVVPQTGLETPTPLVPEVPVASAVTITVT